MRKDVVLLGAYILARGDSDSDSHGYIRGLEKIEWQQQANAHMRYAICRQSCTIRHTASSSTCTYSQPAERRACIVLDSSSTSNHA